MNEWKLFFLIFGNVEPTVEWHIQGKTQGLGENPVAVPLCTPKILLDWPGREPGPPRWEPHYKCLRGFDLQRCSSDSRFHQDAYVFTSWLYWQLIQRLRGVRATIWMTISRRNAGEGTTLLGEYSSIGEDQSRYLTGVTLFIHCRTNMQQYLRTGHWNTPESIQ
jgi:hypothetical protein